MSEQSSPLHSVGYAVQRILEQRLAIEKALLDAWPSPPAQSNAPRQDKSRIAAQIFARELGKNATVENAIELLTQDPVGAASFLDASTELLRAENPRAKVSFDIQTQQEKMELGHLCAFVDFQLSNMLRKHRELFDRPMTG